MSGTRTPGVRPKAAARHRVALIKFRSKWISGAAVAPVISRLGTCELPALRRMTVMAGMAGLAVMVAACSRGGTTRSGADLAGGREASTVDPKYGTTPSPRVLSEGQRIPKGGGTYKVGAPYRIAGRLYVPQEDPNYDRTGIASWYGTAFHGRKTANGEIFDMDALTAAHPTLPLPSYAYVTNLTNGRTVLVRINDRGPYANDRIIDLSRRVARLLGSEQSGLTQVRVRYAGRAPLDGSDHQERTFVAQQAWYRSMVAADGSSTHRWGRPFGLGASMVD